MRSRNTKPELLLRQALRDLGYRYRVHVAQLPGTPDIVFHRKKVVVFVHGCYWHRHSKCVGRRFKAATTQEQLQRFNRTVARDHAIRHALEDNGWAVHVAWECDICRDAVGEAVRVEQVLRARA